MKAKGKVVCETFSPGSKSEHLAVYLDTGRKRYRLVLGNPFENEALRRFAGMRVQVEGILVSPATLKLSEKPKPI